MTQTQTRLKVLHLLLATLIAGWMGACDWTPKAARTDMHGLTPFHQAAREGDVQTVTTHLENGVSPDLRDTDGVTALHRAARDGKMEMAQLLLQYGAETNVKTNTQWTALHLAVQYGHPQIAGLLLQYNADPDAQTPNGWTALHLAAMTDNERCATMTLRPYTAWEMVEREGENGNVEYEQVTHGERRASVDIKDGEGFTPFQRALEREAWDVASILLDHPVDVAAPLPGGEYPAHVLVANAPEHVAAKVLGKGIDVNRQDRNGRTLLQLAYDRQSTYLAQMIYGMGGR